MSDRTDYRTFRDAAPSRTTLELEATRLAFVAARMRALEWRELELLELAVNADDDAGRELELEADTAWRDAHALGDEHGLASSSWPEGAAPER